MTSRQRVIAALNFQETDRIPKDLGGMASTGISAFAYPELVEALGLPIDTQHTLPLGSISDVENEVKQITSYLSKDGGYVFNSIHNLLSEGTYNRSLPCIM